MIWRTYKMLIKKYLNRLYFKLLVSLLSKIHITVFIEPVKGGDGIKIIQTSLDILYHENRLMGTRISTFNLQSTQDFDYKINIRFERGLLE